MIITLVCDNCKEDFSRQQKQHTANLKRGQIHTFCSYLCACAYREYPLVTQQCAWCEEEFTYPQGRSRSRKYCSQSCSAKHKNRTRTIKASPKLCATCKTVTVYGKRLYCDGCKSDKQSATRRVDVYETTTLQEWRAKYSISQYHAKIRGNSRYNYSRSHQPMSCKVCGYSTHVDICHIKDLKDFQMSTTIAEVNHIDNLVALCKNHHWEFDNGHLNLS